MPFIVKGTPFTKAQDFVIKKGMNGKFKITNVVKIEPIQGCEKLSTFQFRS